MPSAIDNQKRISEFPVSQPKRIRQEFSSPFIQWLSTTKEHFPLQLSIQSIGRLSQVCREAHEIAQQIFLPKAQEMGLNGANAVDAKWRWRQLYTFMRMKDQDLPLSAIDVSIQEYTRLDLTEIFTTLSNKKFYRDSDSPLLDLFEATSCWKNAQVTDQALPQGVIDMGYQALCYAAYYRRRNLVNRLLEHQADTDNRHLVLHPKKSTLFLPKPLQCSILAGDIEIVKAILSKNPNLNVNYTNGYVQINPNEYVSVAISLLECAIGGSKAHQFHDQASLNLTMIQFLLEQGVKPTNCDLIAAAEVASLEVMELLLKHSGALTQDLASQALIKLVKYSCERDPLGPDDSTKAMFQYLLNNGADVNNGPEHPIGDHPPLHLAILSKNIEWVRLIIAAQDNLEILNEWGARPLHHAVLTGNISIVECLLKAGADVNAQIEEEDGERHLSVLSFTCVKNDDDWPTEPESHTPEMVKLLLSYGAKPLLEGQSEEYSPLYLARQNGFTEIARILEEYIAVSFLAK